MILIEDPDKKMPETRIELVPELGKLLMLNILYIKVRIKLIS